MSATEAGHDFGGLKIEYRALGPVTNALHFYLRLLGSFYYQKMVLSTFFCLGWALCVKNLAHVESLALLTFGANFKCLK